MDRWGFVDQKKILCMVPYDKYMSLDMSLYLLELRECMRPRVNHDVNYKLWVNMIGQYSLIN